MSVEIATLISEMCYNPDTDAPFTVGMIQRAMKDSHITVKMNQSPKKQALSIIQVLKKKMRIERNQMKIQLAFPEHRTSSPRVTSSDSDGDDVLLFENGTQIEKLSFMRSQAENSHGQCLCLADYVAPKSSGIADSVALFVATAGTEADAFAESFKKAGDDYSYILAQTLCDAIAETLSEYAQKRIFSDSPQERAGVRAAVGYASYPDHSEKAKFEKLLGLKQSIGVELTDNFMMTPKSTVAALWIANPSAKYFSAEIAADQIADYAARNARTLSDTEKYVSVKPLK